MRFVSMSKPGYRLRRRLLLALPGALLILALAAAGFAQQTPDPTFNASVERPAFTKKDPRVLFRDH
jgi:hypothetical protein